MIVLPFGIAAVWKQSGNFLETARIGAEVETFCKLPGCFLETTRVSPQVTGVKQRPAGDQARPVPAPVYAPVDVMAVHRLRETSNE